VRTRLPPNFAGHDPRKAVLQAFVEPKHVADFARSNADVSGRNIRMLADVTMQLDHQ